MSASLPARLWFRAWLGCALLFFCLVCLDSVIAQDVSLDSPEATSTNSSNVAQESSEPPALNENPPLPQAETPSTEGNGAIINTDRIDHDVSGVPHKFHYAARVNLRGIYDDNIDLTNTGRRSDYYFAIEPAVTLGVGDIVERQENYMRLDYAPSIFLFVNHTDFNAVQHLIRLEGQRRFSRLTLSVSQDVQLLEGANLDTNALSTNGAVLDTAGRTRLDLYITHLNASYDLTGKTFLTAGVDYTVNDYDGLISSEYGDVNLYFNYNYSPKLVIGLGGSVGYDWVDSPSPDQTFQQINARATYQVTGKISLNASLGVEFRQFQDDSRGLYISPVYELGATYQPFDGTVVTLTGGRRTLNSAVFADADYDATNIIFGIRQRLLQRVYLGLTAGYENTSYFSTVDGVNTSRDDNYFFVEPGVDIMITRFWTAGVYYLHRENNSTVDDFSFYDNQVGIRSSFTF